jgi:oligopeptide transport system substrate-binding protein
LLAHTALGDEGRRQMRQTLRIPALAVLAVFVLISALGSSCGAPAGERCGGDPAAAQHAGAHSRLKGCAPPQKQIVNVLAVGSANGDVATLDPAHVTGGVDYDIARLLFPPLLTTDTDLKLIDWATQTHEVSPDGRTWTFHLRSGMEWSDGVAIDASTFAYAINRTLDPCTHSEAAPALLVIRGAAAFHVSPCPAGAVKSAQTLIGSSLRTIDPKTLQVTLDAQDPAFPLALTTPGAWAVPERLIAADPTQWTTRLPSGMGFGGNLYKLTVWDHASKVELKRNDTFWGAKPILDFVRFILYHDAAKVASHYAAGEGELSVVPVGLSGKLHAFTGSTYTAIPALDLTYLLPNWRLPPFDDLRMRQAFALSLDRRAMLRDAGRATDLPTVHIVVAGLPGYNGDLRDQADRRGDAALTAAPAQALALAQSYATDSCGGSLRACPPIALTIADTTEQQALAQQLLAQWRAVFPDLTVALHAVDPAARDEAERRAQLTLLSWRSDLPDTLGLLRSQLHAGSSANRGAANVVVADALVDQATAESAGGAFAPAVVMQAEQLYVTNVAWIPLAQAAFGQSVRTVVDKLTYGADQHISLVTWQQVFMKA